MRSILPSVLLVAAALAGAEPPATAPPPAARDTLSRLVAALEMIHQYYIEPAKISDPQHTTAALRAFVASLDPDARLLAPGEIPLTNTPPTEPTTPLKFLGDGIAYLRLPQFSVEGVERFRHQLRRAETDRARALILDLRNNPGGDFGATLAAAQMFLPARQEIVTLAYPNGPGATFSSDTGAKFRAALVLLVNSGTSGEAEIFAAALRDHKRARLVGAPTAGRGRFMSRFQLPDGFSLLLPVAYFTPPSKKLFHGTGVTPDFPVELAPETERRLAAEGFSISQWPANKQALLAVDLPLAKAIELLTR